MSRETENTLLLLVGVSTAIVTLSGTYTRYVKPSLQPWLLASAVFLIALALVCIVRDIRRGPHATDEPGPHHDGGHQHRSGVLWLLLVPVGLLAFIAPPAIGPQTARPAVAESSDTAQRRPFPPLPDDGHAAELSLPELLIRIAQDSAGTLDHRRVSVTGFTIADGGRTDLGRIVILCCAADAQLARIRLAGPAADAAARLADGTWVRLEGSVPAGQRISSDTPVPQLQVDTVQQIEPPKNTYSY